MAGACVFRRVRLCYNCAVTLTVLSEYLQELKVTIFFDVMRLNTDSPSPKFKKPNVKRTSCGWYGDDTMCFA